MKCLSKHIFPFLAYRKVAVEVGYERVKLDAEGGMPWVGGCREEQRGRKTVRWDACRAGSCEVEVTGREANGS